MSLFSPERMQNLDATHVGEVGEYLVASILGGYGFEVVKANGKGYDLIVMPRNDKQRAIRVDVKTRSTDGARSFGIKKGKTTAFRGYETNGCDIFAFVCLEDLSLAFRKCEDYVGKNSVYLNREEHKNTDPYESWLEAVR